MRRDKQARRIVRKTIKLFNAVARDYQIGEKVYMEEVSLAVGGCWFELRKVFLRFLNGPAIDLSIEDMDRLVAAYLRLRGIGLPNELTKRKKPPIQGDFCLKLPRSRSGGKPRSSNRATSPTTCPRIGTIRSISPPRRCRFQSSIVHRRPTVRIAMTTPCRSGRRPAITPSITA